MYRRMVPNYLVTPYFIRLNCIHYLDILFFVIVYYRLNRTNLIYLLVKAEMPVISDPKINVWISSVP